MKDSRLGVYRYWDQLLEHIGSHEVIFDGSFVYPRQMEIHLPGDGKRACNLGCSHCAGKYFNKALGNWEETGLRLLDNVGGEVPYHIYGGAYTEPLLDPYLMKYLRKTKEYGNHFGIHTNGTLLTYDFLKELNEVASDKVDYLSISLDAGTAESWCRNKNTDKRELFRRIIQSIYYAADMNPSHAIRICYLIDRTNDTLEDIESVVNSMTIFGVDSLRFSIPFGNYNQSFDKIREYKKDTEIPLDEKYRLILEPYLSKSQDEKPYIFYTGPEFTDIDRFNFSRCAYGYYQITLGADGYFYKCSTTATPTMSFCRLGKITDDLEKFKDTILRNQDPCWNANICFNAGARCNRMGLEINSECHRIFGDR